MYPYPFQTAPYLAQLPQTQSIQYVNDRKIAETYQMGASSSVILMDANQPRFYLKQTDASGVASIRAYDFKEAEQEKPVEYVTRSEFEKFKAKLNGGNKNEPANDANRKQ